MVTSFRYLGRLISAVDNDCLVLVRNLALAKALWQRLMKILIREGAAPQVFAFFFKAVVQLVLFFGEKTWVVTSAE